MSNKWIKTFGLILSSCQSQEIQYDHSQNNKSPLLISNIPGSYSQPCSSGNNRMWDRHDMTRVVYAATEKYSPPVLLFKVSLKQAEYRPQCCFSISSYTCFFQLLDTWQSIENNVRSSEPDWMQPTAAPLIYLTSRSSQMYLVLRLSVALCELSERAEVPLETSQLGSRGRARFSIAAATPLP